MNRALLNARNEISKMKRADDASGKTTVDIVLVFDRSEAEMKKLVGYADFEKALAELGGEHTEENIRQACEISHFSRESVHFDDMENRQHDDIHIPVKCDLQQARALQYAHNFRHTHIV